MNNSGNDRGQPVGNIEPEPEPDAEPEAELESYKLGDFKVSRTVSRLPLFHPSCASMSI